MSGTLTTIAEWVGIALLVIIGGLLGCALMRVAAENDQNKEALHREHFDHDD